MINVTLIDDFRAWYVKNTDYARHFSDKDKALLNWLCNKYKEIVYNELAFVMDKFWCDYRYLNIGYETQKEFSNLLEFAEKIEADNNPDNFKVVWIGCDEGKKIELPGMVNNHKEIFIEYKKYLKSWAEFLKKQPHSQHIKGKNSLVKQLTKELFDFLQCKFDGIGPTQARCVIGYLFFNWNIYLEKPLHSEDELEDLNFSTYDAYLDTMISSYLR